MRLMRAWMTHGTAGVVMGVTSRWLFGEHFTDTPAKVAIAVLAFAVMAAGVTVLTRTAPQDLAPSRPASP
jgi:hypothetical protein